MEPNGIIHNGGNPTGPNIYLPLEQLEARAIIIDGKIVHAVIDHGY